MSTEPIYCRGESCGVLLTPENREYERKFCRKCWLRFKQESRRRNAANPKLPRVLTPETVLGTERKKKQFLAALLENGGFVEAAIREVKTSRAFVNQAYNTDIEFARLWDTIVELGNEKIEQEIYRRAVVGVDKPLAYQGKLTGDVIKEWSDTLLMFYAKARMPAKYRDLPQKGAELTDEELNAQLAKYLEKRVGRGKVVPVIEVEAVN